MKINEISLSEKERVWSYGHKNIPSAKSSMNEDISESIINHDSRIATYLNDKGQRRFCVIIKD